MEPGMEKYKGLHPGAVLERELKKRKQKKGPFALALQEYPQTLNEITKGRRGMTPALSLKIDEALGLEEGTMLVLQAYHEIKKEKQKANLAQHPNMSILRKILFWDTDVDKIDWQRQYKAVIERVFERGNNDEKKEILRFYGEDKVNAVIDGDGIANNRLHVMRHINPK